MLLLEMGRCDSVTVEMALLKKETEELTALLKKKGAEESLLKKESFGGSPAEVYLHAF